MNEFYDAFRKGLGETRLMQEVRGHLFEPCAYGELDEHILLPPEKVEIGLLTSIFNLIVISSWDGWLVCQENFNRIEFLEGNINFYSDDKAKIFEAKLLIKEFFHREVRQRGAAI